MAKRKTDPEMDTLNWQEVHSPTEPGRVFHVVLADGRAIPLYLPQYVRFRLEEALDTLKKLYVGNTRPAKIRSAHPEVMQEFWEMWNALTSDEKKERADYLNRTRIPPAPEQITRMDEVVPDWFQHIKRVRDRRVVMAIASGFSFRRVARHDGRSHETMRQIYKRSIEEIAYQLNGFDNWAALS